MTPYMQGWDIEDQDFQRVSDNLQITKKLIRSSYSVNLDVFLELAEPHLLKSVLEYLYMLFFFICQENSVKLEDWEMQELSGYTEVIKSALCKDKL